MAESSSLTSWALNPNALKALYTGNLLWHSSAFYHFAFRAAYMMRKLSRRARSRDPAISSTPSGDPWHHDIMAYLGYINVGFAALAAWRLNRLRKSPPSTGASPGELDAMALTVLAIANGSQALGNFERSRMSGRWIMGSGLDRITVLDTVFMVLDGLAALAYTSKAKN